MAINLLLHRLSKRDFVKIIKAVIYIIYRKEVLNKELVFFIYNLAKMYNLSDEEFEDLFLIDARYELRLNSVIKDLDKQAIKIMLFIMLIFDNIFPHLELKEHYIKHNILNSMPIDKDIINDIQTLCQSYIDITLRLHNFIYSKENDTNSNTSQNFFLLDIKKLNSLSKKERYAFLYTLYTFMKDDDIISSIESKILEIWALYLEIDFNYFMRNIDMFAYKNIQKDWIKRFLALSYITTQNDTGLAVLKVAKYLPFDKYELRELKSLSIEYLNVLTSLYSKLYSNVLTNLNENLALNMKLSFDLGEVALMLIPQFKAFILMQKINAIRRTIGLALESSQIDKKIHDIKVLKKNKFSNSIIICIDGYLSENRKNQFQDWLKGLNTFGVKATILGFSWEASNYKKVINGGVSSWYETVHNTLKASRYLAQYIVKLKRSNPKIKITLMGHSLGARVIFNTLYHLAKNGNRVEQVLMFAGAKRVDRVIWADVLTAVKSNVFNFYTRHDRILKHFYQISMFNTPIGISPLKIVKMREHKNLTLINCNLSHMVKGHNEYKKQLPKILNIVKHRLNF